MLITRIAHLDWIEMSLVVDQLNTCLGMFSALGRMDRMSRAKTYLHRHES